MDWNSKGIHQGRIPRMRPPIADAAHHENYAGRWWRVAIGPEHRQAHPVPAMMKMFSDDRSKKRGFGYLPKTLLLLTGILPFLVIGCDSSDTDADDEFTLTGTWQGLVAQSGGGYPTLVYPVSMEIRELVPGEESGSITYLHLNCSGRLTFDRNSSGVYIFFEEITTNQDKCTTQGRIDVEEKSSREIIWEWHEVDGRGPFGVAILKKK